MYAPPRLMMIPVALAVAVAAACASDPPATTTGSLIRQLAHDDARVADEAIARLVEMGTNALPELDPALSSDDPRVSSRARVAVARITGQWGSGCDGILWKRSMADAIADNPGQRPLVVLHLFGEFDEEFC